MTDSYVGVNYAKMGLAQEGLLKVVTQMDEATDGLIADLKTILGDSWTGDTKIEFEAYHLKWDGLEREMGNLLREAANAIGTATQNYQAAEMRNRAIWSDPSR